MKFDEVNAISTAIISYVAIVGLMTGLYFNMKPLNIGLFYIILFEIIFAITICMFILWVRKKAKNET